MFLNEVIFTKWRQKGLRQLHFKEGVLHKPNGKGGYVVVLEPQAVFSWPFLNDLMAKSPEKDWPSNAKEILEKGEPGQEALVKSAHCYAAQAARSCAGEISGRLPSDD